MCWLNGLRDRLHCEIQARNLVLSGPCFSFIRPLFGMHNAQFDLRVFGFFILDEKYRPIKGARSPLGPHFDNQRSLFQEISSKRANFTRFSAFFVHIPLIFFCPRGSLFPLPLPGYVKWPLDHLNIRINAFRQNDH